VRADERHTAPTVETWDAAYLGNAKIGYLHTTTRPIERDGKKLFRTIQELRLTLKRYQQVGEIRMESGTEEDAEGKVDAVFMTQYLEGKKLVVTGKVNGDLLHIRGDNGRIDKDVPWNSEAIGLYRQERLFREKKAAPGDTITFSSYEPTISSSVTVHAVVRKAEQTDILRADRSSGKVERVREKLLRVETTPDEIKIGKDNLKLPGMVIWLDKELLPARSEVEIQPLGKIIFYRTTKAAATAASGTADLSPDIGLSSMIRLNRAIPRPHDVSKVVYRITVKGDDKPETALAQDARQRVENAKGQTFELHVRAVRTPQGGAKDEKADAQFLESNYFIDSDSPRVKALANEAVGDETGPWRRAQAIERWIHERMRGDSSVAFCTASQVAKDLRGDCRQHAMLTAAMCRAAGVPSRTALGLIYVNRSGQRPEMGFHMWTEVWISGEWVGIDGTLGRGSIGAAHVKISDHSWHEVQSLTPMLPVARVLGKLSIEVVRVE
ncbi:MAG TPA: transglutaminase family protein, partial [Gemmataceae bacterium]|nr:transglutaminase family protein [Gemmataceae bacterium]